ncbi:MAG: beta-lactamase family protein [Acidobacteria bacterium]|nr:beta-lactamase family protein [Acidobacteriota bacterium]
MGKIRLQTVLGVFVLGAGVLAAVLFGLFAYMSITTKPLHPDAQAVPTSAAGGSSPAWAGAAEQARQSVRAGLAEQNLPGVSVAVAAGGEIVWAEGFGFADLENRVTVTPETRFPIGTASTMLTSAGAGLLIQKDLLKIDETIQMYVPEFPEKPWPVTVRQLMAHQAGLRSDGGDESPLYGLACERPVDALETFGDDPLQFEPGTHYRYSNFGWILVSAAVESAAGEPFMRYMRRHVFEPLGMEDTRDVPATEPVSGRAISYFPRFGGDPRYGPDVMRPIDMSCYAGASAFLSTPSDLVRFVAAIEGGKLLQPATVALLQASGRLASGADTGYGLGWDHETVTLAGSQTPVIGHDGDLLGGMAVSIMKFPEHGLIVAVASNTSYADTFGLGVKIAEAFAARRKTPAR